MTHFINGIQVYADVTNHPETGAVLFVDLALHSPTQEALVAAALVKNLMVVRAEATGPEEARDANFFDVAVALEPAVLTAAGEVATSAVMDPAFSVNLRIAGDMANSRAESGWLLWELLLLEWMGLGADGVVNGKVPGVAVSGVSLVDLSKVATRQGRIA